MLYSKVRTRRVSTGSPPSSHDRGERHLEAVDAPVVGELLFHRRPAAVAGRHLVALGADQIRHGIEQQDDRLHGAAADANRGEAAAVLDDIGKTGRGHLAVGERQQQPDDVALHGAAHLVGLGGGAGRTPRASFTQHSPPVNTRTTGPDAVVASTRNEPGYWMYDVVSKVTGPADPPTIVVVAVALTVRIDRSLSSPPLALTARATTSRTDACGAVLAACATRSRPGATRARAAPP